MKKVLVIIISFIGLLVNAQSNVFIINHSVDVITGEQSFFPEKKIVIEDEYKGFYIIPSLNYIGKELILESLLVVSNVGSMCVEKSTLYILLDNDRVIKLSSWNELNCDGISYFDVSKDESKYLSESNIRLVRFVNGSDSSQLEDTPDKDQLNFFVNMFSNYKIIESK